MSESRPDRSRRIMAEEVGRLAKAKASCASLAIDAGLDPGRAWLAWLVRHGTDLECRQAEVTDAVRMALDAVESKGGVQ